MKLKSLMYLLISACLAVFFANRAFALQQNVQSTKDIQENTVKQITAEKRTIKNCDNKLLTGGIEKELIDLSSDINIFSKDKKINLMLDNIDVASVLKIISNESKKNIMVDDSVKGYINADLKNISLNEAFKLILSSQELEARIDNATIFVASRKAMVGKGLNRKYVKAFKLNNANAVTVAQILEASVFNKGYNIKEDNGASTASAAPSATQAPAQGQESSVAAPSLAVEPSGGEIKLAQDKTIKGRIEEVEPGEGFSSAKILASEIKIQGIKASTKSITVANNDGGPIVVPDSRTNSVLVSGLQQDILVAQKAIEYLDKPLEQVAIEVSLIEISKEDIKNIGVSTNGLNGPVDGGFNNAVGNARQALTTDGNQNYWVFQSSKNNAGDMYVRLNTLLQNKKAKLLANPTIIALDGSESLIKITDQVVSKMEIYVTQNTSSYNVTMSDVGIVLNILPKIGNDGFVTMKIRPSITSSLAERAVGPSGGFVTPISTREVIIQDSRVKSGDTLAIAGLIKDNDLETIGKLPVLSSLPFIGSIFQSKEHKSIKTELVILITPKIIDSKNTNI